MSSGATTNAIRQKFIDFFADAGHQPVASSPLVPRNDPTLMFTNAGMVQFKNVFTGTEQRDYKRAVTSQKCVRAGGKHNDLENVGYTARHHTFFEMLGNFSFGDYFKENAIEYAWNLITRDYGLPKDKLLVTVYSEDDEAHALWKKIAGLSDEKIIRIPTSDNFWAMGDTGPCGPCSEIFFDHGDHIPGGPPGSPDEDGDRFIEIWNLVFMQFEQVSLEERISLPKPSIDTGMGLERIAAVLQGKHDNYDIDLMRALIEASANVTNGEPDGERAVSHRVIADHLRATSFLIADGVLPSNEGRGYVLRRIMRRAMRHAHLLGAEEPVVYKLVPALIAQMGEAFPELRRAEALITETLKLEESRFKKTLSRGLGLLDQESAKLGDRGTLPGDVAFKLYDTYGFPLDLTQDVLRGEGKTVDTDGFNAAMEQQKAEARKAWAGSGEAATETVWFELREQVGATEFLGYDTEHAEAEIRALVADGKPVESIAAGGEGFVITNQTPFYGESGGQMGDTGGLFSAEGVEATITDTQKKLGDLFVHVVKVTKGTLKKGLAVELSVDNTRRSRIRANHSATHLLHEALRRHLGDHVAQKGSLVAPERLRFDISHQKPMSADELIEIEREVNARIRENSPVTTRLMSIDEAMESGARALFGEKYGDEVRVVSMGKPEAGSNIEYSVELCGGTHVAQTGDIGMLRIVSESAVSAGVRRVEAVTAGDALELALTQERQLQATAEALKTTPATVTERVQALLDERKKLEREVSELRRQLAAAGGGGANSNDQSAEARDVGGVAYIGRVLADLPAKELKPLADTMKQKLGSGVVALVAVSEGKASVVVGVTDDLTGKVSAVDLVRVASDAVGGKGGGGRPDMAQAGGPDGAAAEAALSAVEQAIAASAG
ncbi:MAG: alanine--tRNA ligase [Alphaproteobacteria bacterium]|nr:alanine--tRNA ligase [Alphaproteobacteria bacterium]MAS49113.1 alanine--tRNA ligase [Alphaproteobacteria bacterium]MBN52499.1 alanine--tRNA ligase [Alphaproteobacteria bacterium]OUT39715.1 MAG: alanine--tRNA ligase [Micavibrio sp. TMED2]|tara:strand:+ start:7669 stop:10353 length:2685 start_codon:yes stop_codon:yes gene_type:complete